MNESINDVLVDCVKACGGSAKVGPKLWPEKPNAAAQRLLLDCLNEERPAKLSPEQVVFILKLAHSKGCHVGMEFLCSDIGYAAPVPTDPRDELVELLKTSNELREKQLAVSSRIEKLMPQAALKAVA